MQITNITVELPEKSLLNIRIYTVTGSKATDIANTMLNEGTHSFTFDTKMLKPVLYVCEAETSKGKISRKLLVK